MLNKTHKHVTRRNQGFHSYGCKSVKLATLGVYFPVVDVVKQCSRFMFQVGFTVLSGPELNKHSSYSCFESG